MANSLKRYRNGTSANRHARMEEANFTTLRGIGLPYSKVTHTARCKLCGDLASANGLCIHCARDAED